MISNSLSRVLARCAGTRFSRSLSQISLREIRRHILATDIAIYREEPFINNNDQSARAFPPSFVDSTLLAVDSNRRKSTEKVGRTYIRAAPESRYITWRDSPLITAAINPVDRFSTRSAFVGVLLSARRLRSHKPCTKSRGSPLAAHCLLPAIDIPPDQPSLIVSDYLSAGVAEK